ncbi:MULTISPECIES: hypothetical protein [Bacillus cereus group]|uniref:DUF1450 domain-containing protein n=1 Tax=Bacillus cytotoxicus (strain DSM 22905 / CIP 110041 / 391-98 / NVH 391-98) TaxID=315749 RepID=A7GKW3_BACCN|nr:MULTISPECIES: hypothetical protein [Bacillus cereus group]ABS20771.1 hypothetical protein Bcer98_0415 [Bacillus cytotoxicus NVH 391-98]AWC27408.1 hypothetical protein CG483_002615 [Bacillus cytotoxicus]AWC41217.1 hypothetical protein CG480_012640 [Bacillus cytotoxicus]AWC43510.1 hypothetical protein CG479_002395 [Bacillus cytotoxicus]AWC49148.1 hypothetical protein CG478_012640 [Bacillus cytotoxicus]
MKKIKVCKRCSNLDVDKIKIYGKELNYKVKVGCIGKCSRSCPELTDKFVGRLDKQFIICDSQEEFLKQMYELK